MQVSRRSFLKYCIGSAASLGLPISVLGKLSEAMAAGGAALPKVIWLAGANCTGCTVSLANLFSDSGPTDLADLLIGYIDLAYHPNLMAAAGDLAVNELHAAAAGDFILVVEGGVPTAFNGHACMLWTEGGRDITAQEAVTTLAPQAAAVLSVGTCASYGGIPAGKPNPTGIQPVDALTGLRTINIPGCPTHPDWIVYTIANLLAGVVPTLDDRGRPAELFVQEVHKICPRKGTTPAEVFGETGCLKNLGCRGPNTKADCPARQWNNKTNWCIGANAMCVGCANEGFPDKFTPLYRVEYTYQPSDTGTGEQDPPTSTAPLEITKCEWRAASADLRVEGIAAAGAIVTVFNADTNAMLGAVSADTNGSWRFRQRNTTPVPSRIRVESDGSSLVVDVPGVQGTPTTDNPEIKISKCEWRADRSELMVDVQGPIGTAVTIKNAGSGALIGTGTIGSDGRLKFRKTNPNPVPCMVRVEAAGAILEQAVVNAPGDCR